MNLRNNTIVKLTKKTDVSGKRKKKIAKKTGDVDWCYVSERTSNVVAHLKAIHKAAEEDINEFRDTVTSNRAQKRHGGGAWQCQKCPQVLATERSLEYHMATKHRKAPVNPADITLSSSPLKTSPPPKKVQLQPIANSLIQEIHTVTQKPKESQGRIDCPVKDCFSSF
ncbi:hypothetical protein B9Z55_019147 [Caenorhabditis nigoni]|uniref:C2H2-type domain-containing protein n=1 Tax=Caenorhabditis nigoni TaxID=1611254 RepID=A0A2G5TH79_9PELO|nr:hypothetical protein B9Z55_019147 [Caenorhabditis nigoni]